jgi:hypothetical protein
MSLGGMGTARGNDCVDTFFKGGEPELLIVGCSGNPYEWSLVEACRCRGGRTAMYVEIGLGRRFKDVNPSSYPDIFLVSNAHCGAELVGLGIERVQVRLVGSCYIEELARRVEFRDESEIRSELNVASSTRMVSFFTNRDMASSKVLETLLRFLDDAPNQQELVVRPHPHMPVEYQAELEAVCSRWSYAHCDSNSSVDTPSLLFYSTVSFTMGSTVSAESLAIGTPSAFFQIGWDYGVYEAFYSNLETIPRIRDRRDFLKFLETDRLAGSSPILEFEFERWDGALDRSWKEIEILWKRDRG